jgi:hypothetical protein
MVYDRPEVIALQGGLGDRAGVGDFGRAIDRHQNNALFNVSNLYPGVDFSVKIDMLESPLLT